MICFPNAKINIGLNIVSKRNDGYHNLETVFYPVPLKDILEFIVPEKTIKKTIIEISGTKLDILNEQNICIKAYDLLAADYNLPKLQVYLHKLIPNGAGLGGGSSDASFFLKQLSDQFKLNISENKLMDYASKLGADCPFFITNKAVFASGTGNKFEHINLDLTGYYILIVKPNFSINTAEAFKGIKPTMPKTSLKELIKQPVDSWKNQIKNDFEAPLFQKYPELSAIKTKLYKLGADYASMSGSGSALFGLFKNKPDTDSTFDGVYKKVFQLGSN
ncbi:MAG: 4-(cytidine 5'-diphospho)-2-C-methyl-D-erythritol kinase [Bacteroidetes bacterium 4572_117]|nr:MAG: 4-(cytidine 5'-diphospho)-2-C-methyl-D-erythritol kinase [Bacteroidetes bacterium 4572_117]